MKIEGIVIYCFTHDDGAIILDTNNILNFENINCINFNKICGENCCKECDWIKQGTAIFDSDIIAEFSTFVEQRGSFQVEK